MEFKSIVGLFWDMVANNLFLDCSTLWKAALYSELFLIIKFNNSSNLILIISLSLISEGKEIVANSTSIDS